MVSLYLEEDSEWGEMELTLTLPDESQSESDIMVWVQKFRPADHEGDTSEFDEPVEVTDGSYTATLSESESPMAYRFQFGIWDDDGEWVQKSYTYEFVLFIQRYEPLGWWCIDYDIDYGTYK